MDTGNKKNRSLITHRDVQKWFESCDKDETLKQKRTIVLTQPFCNAELLQAMAIYGGNHRVMGQRNKEIDKAIIKFAIDNEYNLVTTTDPYETILNDHLNNTQFLRWANDRDAYNKRKMQVFMDGFFDCTSFRTAMLGWGLEEANSIDYLIEAVELAESYLDIDINIIFLIDDSDAIASRLSVEGITRESIRDLAEIQRSRMLGARRLDDVVITRDNLLADPMSYLKHVNRNGYRPQYCFVELVNRFIYEAV